MAPACPFLRSWRGTSKSWQEAAAAGRETARKLLEGGGAELEDLQSLVDRGQQYMWGGAEC